MNFLEQSLRNRIRWLEEVLMKQNHRASKHQMSHDRVRFYLGYRQCNNSKIADILYRAFGIDATEFAGIFRRGYSDPDGGQVIVCRPSQFARFLIYRNEAGMTNGFKNLGLPNRNVQFNGPELFVPQAVATDFEVWKRPFRPEEN